MEFLSNEDLKTVRAIVFTGGRMLIARDERGASTLCKLFDVESKTVWLGWLSDSNGARCAAPLSSVLIIEYDVDGMVGA